jgi:signal transduction histidine kinase
MKVTSRSLAWSIWAASLASALAWVIVDAFVQGSDSGILDDVFIFGAVLLYATVGALITSRQPGNRVGLIFAWVGMAAAVGGASGAYAQLAAEHDLPLASATTWLANLGVVAIIGPIAFLFLIYPTGTPPSRRWGWLLKVMLGAFALTIVLFALTPGRMKAGFADVHSRLNNPIALPADWRRGVEVVTISFGFVVFAGAMLSIVSLIQRYRRAEPQERQQIRWLAWLGASTAVYMVALFGLEATGILPEEGALADLGFVVLIGLIFLGIPVTCAVAILKHGLWDLDLVVKKTLQYGVLVVAVTLVLGVVLFLAPTLVMGVGGTSGGAIPFFVGVVLTIGVLLVRERAKRWANRVVYGKRSTPYEVLSEFADRVGETYSTEDVLPRMAQLLGEATGARVARVWLRVGQEMKADASWPPGAPDVPDVEILADELPSFGDDTAFEVQHQGELLGALTVTEAPDDPMNPTKTKLANDMASQAGLVLRNVRLIEDLRESRRRIVSAQDIRAKKLERDIHDGAQQQLVALAVKLGLVERFVGTDPDRAAAMLAEAKAETTEALDDLRDLARGIYPPLLADQGLAAALEAQARKSSLPVVVEPDGIGRYAQPTEAAVYFSCLEALNNVAKYADSSSVEIRLRQRDGELRFEVEDDGVGFEPGATTRGTGLQGIADRLDALGGRLEIRTAPGEGTTLVGLVPSPVDKAP